MKSQINRLIFCQSGIIYTNIKYIERDFPMFEKLKKSKITLILIGLMASLLLSAMDSTVVGTAMKSIAESLGGMQYYSWPFTIYMMCSTIAIPVCGGLADIYGHKPMFLFGISAFLTGSVLCGISQSMIQLIIFRGFQGIGGGMIVSGVFTTVADMFPPTERGKYTGIVTSMYGLASIIGPLAGGFITDSLGWRYIFFFNFPIGIAAIVIIASSMPGFKSGESKKSVDYIGIAALVMILVPLLLDFSMAGKNYSWVSVPCLGLFALAAAMTAVFAVLEKKSANPLISPAFLKDRAISMSFLIAFFSQAIMFSAIIYLPYFIQGVIGSSASTSGAVITPMMLGLLLASNLTGQFISRIGKAKILAASSFVVMGIGAFLLSTMGTATTYKTAIVFMIILGFGVGMSMPITNVNAQNAAPKQQIGSVTSNVMFSRNIGSTIGSAVYGAIMTYSLKNGFAGIDMHRLPVKIQTMLSNTQIITNAKAVAAIRAKVPKLYVNYFDGIYSQTKAVLASSIHSVFLFCVCIAAAGFVSALFLREVRVIRRKKQLEAKS